MPREGEAQGSLELAQALLPAEISILHFVHLNNGVWAASLFLLFRFFFPLGIGQRTGMAPLV